MRVAGGGGDRGWAQRLHVKRRLPPTAGADDNGWVLALSVDCAFVLRRIKASRWPEASVLAELAALTRLALEGGGGGWLSNVERANSHAARLHASSRTDSSIARTDWGH